MSHPLVSLPLSALRRSKLNVRKTDTKTAIDELAASIASQGLLENLIVRANGDDSYDVVAGGRRLEALKRLEKHKKIAADFTVSCLVLPSDTTAAAIEVSLAENMARVALHPADQFEAFAKLGKEGLGIEDIAARFGVTLTVVRQRLKLASVSPRLIAIYRDGAMDLEQLMAFSITDDLEAQDQVWNELANSDPDPRTIKRLLTQAHVHASDRRALFIGRKSYEKAGGAILKDLFSEEDDGYFTDFQLLDQLVREKLEKEAGKLRKEGWSWIEVRPENEYIDLSSYGRLRMVQVTLPDEDEARLRTLSARYDEIVAKLEDEDNDALNKELDAVSNELEALQDKKEAWPDDGRTNAGAVISLDYTGCPQIVRGLIRPDDKRKLAKAAKESETNGSADGRGNGASGYSDALVLDLSAHRTAALQESLARKPGVALDALVHHLAMHVFFTGHVEDACLKIKPIETILESLSPTLKASKAFAALERREGRWRERLPKKEDGLWRWLQDQSRRDKLELLAFCVALTLDALDRRNGASHASDADALARALGLDMAEWWRPDESFFTRLTKAQILDAVREGVSPEAASKLEALKKGEMAERAVTLVAPTRWLPPVLRAAESNIEVTLQAIAVEIEQRIDVS